MARNLFLYIGGMGAKSKNFYNDYETTGYEEAAEKIQDLYLEGKKDEAAMAVKMNSLTNVHWLTKRTIEQLSHWKELDKTGKIGTLVLENVGQKAIEVIVKRGL